MRMLLDTHTVLWFLTGDAHLSISARRAIENPDNEVLLSVASLWEIAIKTRLGRLEVRSSQPVTDTILDDLEDNNIGILGIEPEHVLFVATLPLGHGDPFDLLLIAQGIVETMPIVGRDTQVDPFGVTRIW